MAIINFRMNLRPPIIAAMLSSPVTMLAMVNVAVIHQGMDFASLWVRNLWHFKVLSRDLGYPYRRFEVCRPLLFFRLDCNQFGGFFCGLRDRQPSTIKSEGGGFGR